MDALSWRCAAKFRLGKALFSYPVRCPSCNKAELDVYGIHASYCTGEGDCTQRHNAVRDLIVQLGKSAKLPVLDHEPGFLLSDSVSGEKPADVFFGNWKLSGNSVVVFALMFALLTNSLELSSGHDGMAPLKKKVDLKRKKYMKRNVGIVDICSSLLCVVPWVVFVMMLWR